MRIAALDVGEARIGVAVSDELGITAQGLGVVRRVGGRRDLEALAALLTPYAPSRLVVGLPLDMRGTEGAAAVRVRAFAERAAAHLALPLEFWDERLTTVAAARPRDRHARRGRALRRGGRGPAPAGRAPPSAPARRLGPPHAAGPRRALGRVPDHDPALAARATGARDGSSRPTAPAHRARGPNGPAGGPAPRRQRLRGGGELPLPARGCELPRLGGPAACGRRGLPLPRHLPVPPPPAAQ